jgi:hypothetical protein
MNHKFLIDHIIVDPDEEGIAMKILNIKSNTSNHLALRASIKQNREKRSIDVLEKNTVPSIKYII